MTVPHYNRVGSILDLKNQRQRDATVGKNPILYAQVDFLEKKIMDRPYVYIFFCIFRNFNEKCPNLTESLPYNSGTTQNDCWIKETDKRAQNGDKKRPKTL
jgi:hypothetical protein